MSQTQVKELTIGAKQALVGDKRRRGLIDGLHFVAEPSSATRLGAAKTEILFLSDWLSKHVDGGGTCGKARIGADVPENFKSTLNDVVERNICKHARLNNLMRSGRTLINGCYHPAGCSGIS